MTDSDARTLITLVTIISASLGIVLGTAIPAMVLCMGGS